MRSLGNCIIISMPFLYPKVLLSHFQNLLYSSQTSFRPPPLKTSFNIKQNFNLQVPNFSHFSIQNFHFRGPLFAWPLHYSRIGQMDGWLKIFFWKVLLISSNKQLLFYTFLLFYSLKYWVVYCQAQLQLQFRLYCQARHQLQPTIVLFLLN